jgi:hypothetical protein
MAAKHRKLRRGDITSRAGVPFSTEKNASFAASQLALAQSAPFCRGITGETINPFDAVEVHDDIVDVAE